MRRDVRRALSAFSLVICMRLVHADGLVFTQSPQNATASVGGELSLSCEADSASLGPVLDWLRDGAPLGHDADSSGGTGSAGAGTHHSIAELALSKHGGTAFVHRSTLTIHRVQQGDVGPYSCQVTLAGGVVVRSKEGWIQVEGRPTITGEPRSLNVSRGEPFTLRCTALGPPEPVLIKWFSSADVQPQQPDNNGSSPSELHVSGISETTSYSCHAANSRGTSVSREARINVKVLPEAPGLPRLVTVSTRDAWLSWNPSFDGFSPLLGCRVQVARDDGQWADADNDTEASGWAPDDDTGMQEVAGVPDDPSYGAPLGGLEPGTDYRARIACHNQVGASPWSPWVRLRTRKQAATLPEFVPWLLGVAAALAILGAVVVVVLWRKKKQQFRSELGPAAADRGEPLIEIPEIRRYRRDNPELTLERCGLSKALSQKLSGVLLKRPCLHLGSVLGEGEFGCVLEGRLKKDDGTKVEVAVKTMKEVCTSSDIESFLNEVLAMKDFDHPNVIRLLGVCLEVCPDQRLPRPMAVLPFMRHGDLHSFLKRARFTRTPVYMPLQTLLQFMVDISRGMEYLSANNFVHRDLAARNCMLHEDLTVCVADFGLTKKIYSGDYYRQGQISRMPVKWLAPECMADRLYTAKSDVWAFGVTMWEIVTRGQAPYPGVANHEMFDFLVTGKRLKQPPDCLDELFAIMSDCWSMKAGCRPTFPVLRERLEELLADLPPLSRREDVLYGNVPSHHDAPQPSGGDSRDDGDGGGDSGCGAAVGIYCSGASGKDDRADDDDAAAAAVDKRGNDYGDSLPAKAATAAAASSVPPPKPARLNEHVGPPAPVATAEWIAAARLADLPAPAVAAVVPMRAPESRGAEGVVTAGSSERSSLLEGKPPPSPTIPPLLTEAEAERQ
ncbi:tyrosine-protein kinase receptor TYRO3-like isoform X2 [Lethenteron reissneri]|uniref:tyrosine-protein kinase receptor TYRO3-like isoform X2 n=1 Tax=Lethenteron reissneri TaxID=7753 RepID=UPI002AB6457A|nr:tyrosine-protein kinase receptor TYRO3-like isoform X2 [Lethenteron reissneri]